MGKPRFSIIIPTLNEEQFLPRLLTSLATQTEKDFEVMVVDGSSQDKTVAKARSFSSKLPRLSVMVSQKASLPLQRNLGAGKARGEWLVFVDADSVLMPQFLAGVRDYLQSHRCQVVTTWCAPDGNAWWERWVAALANLTIEASVLLGRQLTPGPLTVVSKMAFAAVGGYHEKYQYFGEDFDFGQRLARGGVRLQIIRKQLYQWSLRRWRSEGAISTLWKYLKAGALAFLTRQAPQRVPGYAMGGHRYR